MEEHDLFSMEVQNENCVELRGLFTKDEESFPKKSF